MAAVMIGVDPRKGSHTAVAIDRAEKQLGRLRVRAQARQAAELVTWAAAWPQRTWAVEGAGGLGHLLAQELVAAGERVLDVQPKLGSRVRLLSSGSANKNDPNDALSVAVAALRSPRPREVRAEDHTAALKLWARRHRDLARLRNQTACRLHAMLASLVPGGIATEITPAQATAMLAACQPAAPPARARHQLAADHVADLHHLDLQLRDTRHQLAAAVKASGTTLTAIFGIGPVIAATIIGDTEDIARFPTRDKFAAWTGTAPIEVSSGRRVVHRLSLRGNRRLNHAIHMAAVTQIRHQHSEGRRYYDKKLAEGRTPKEALRSLKRRISNAVYATLRADARHAAAETGPGGQPGNDSASSAAGSHPARQLFGQATPEPSPQPTTPNHQPPARTKKTRQRT
jgi:transposase